MYNVKDNAEAQLQFGISSVATILVVKDGQGTRFPEVPFLAVINKRNSEGEITKSEKVEVSAVNGDQFTINRGFEGTTPLDFSADDFVSLFVLARHIEDLKTELDTKASIEVEEDIENLEQEITNLQNQINTIISGSTESVLSNGDYLAGENISKGDSLFVEEMVGFSENLLTQDIGHSVLNKKIAIKLIGSGKAGNKINLALAKSDNLGVDLLLRIEGDNNGKPNGQLIDSNAEITVARSSLSLNLEDKELTFPENFTIGKGQECYIVLSQVGDVVDNDRYFKIGFSPKHTNIRHIHLFNGVWDYTGEGTVDNTDVLYNDTSQTTTTYGVKATALKHIQIESFQVAAGCSATKGYIKDEAGRILGRGNINNGVCIFSSPIIIREGDVFTAVVNADGSKYKYKTLRNGSFMVTKRNIKYTGGTGTNNFFNIQSITSREFGQNYGFCYINSDLFENSLLCKTDATYPYKISRIPRISKGLYDVGSVVKYDYDGITRELTGLTPDTIMYISKIPGKLSNIPDEGCPFFVGITIGNSEIHLGKGISKGDMGDILYGPWQDIQLSNNNSKVLEFVVGDTGQYTLYYAGSHAHTSIFLSLYKNGTPIMPEQYYNVHYFSENIDFFAKCGDVITMYGRKESSSYAGIITGAKVLGKRVNGIIRLI